MTDERTDPSAAFALQLAGALITALVVENLIPATHAEALVTDALSGALDSHPDHEQPLRGIAAALTGQIRVAVIARDEGLAE